MAEKNRPLHILKYLWDHTDEEHPAIITDILAHLGECGIQTNRKTVASDLVDLQESGFDIVCYRSRQNKYFIGSRSLELAELKMIVDAVQAAKFISESKSVALIEKVSSLASPHQAEQLRRRLYVEGKAKTTNENVNYTVDLLQSAIQSQIAVEFQYIEYTPTKEKILKYDGYTYSRSLMTPKEKPVRCYQRLTGCSADTSILRTSALILYIFFLVFVNRNGEKTKGLDQIS